MLTLLYILRVIYGCAEIPDIFQVSTVNKSGISKHSCLFCSLCKGSVLKQNNIKIAIYINFKMFYSVKYINLFQLHKTKSAKSVALFSLYSYLLLACSSVLQNIECCFHCPHCPIKAVSYRRRKT